MRRTSFNAGWEHRPLASFFAEFAGSAQPWQEVMLPHDAQLALPRGAEHGPGSGYFPGGAWEYRKTFDVPDDYRDRHVLLEFEGVYRHARVYLNDSLAAHWASGYTGFVVELDGYLEHGTSNTVRVEARAHKDARWYSGAGIYRDVHLVVGNLLHIAHDGVRVVTRDVDADRAVVEVMSIVENRDRSLSTVSVVTDVRSDDGHVVAGDVATVSAPPGERTVVRQRLYVRNPRLWSPDDPALHTIEVALRDGDEHVDGETVTVGIRTLQADPENGLRINGRPVKLRGACVHHDNGVLGAATIARADERRVQLLKQAGFNALRSAHTPMSRTMLDACDRVGMIVMDESFDTWNNTKSDFDYSLEFPEWWERDLEAMVQKDRNHPSVVFYSIGNEIPELGRPRGTAWARRLAEHVRALDDTRLVTAGVNGLLAALDEVTAARKRSASAGINTLMTDMVGISDEIAQSDVVTRATTEAFGVLDVAGMNYLSGRYELDAKLFPNRMIVGTETFPTKIDELWRQVLDNSHVLGDFTWTGWDYLGEAGVGRVVDADDPTSAQFMGAYPHLTAGVGDVDITGHRRTLSYYREIVFGLREQPYIAVVRPSRHGRELRSGPWAWSDSVASWSWEGYEGRPVTVEVYSDADSVELLLDGTSVGRACTGPEHRYRASFELTYQPGTLTAIASSAGQVRGRTSLTSAVGAVCLAVTSDRQVIRDDDRDLAFVAIALTDPQGTVWTGKDREITVQVTGPAVLQGLGSGAPCTEESYLDATHTTFDGRALAVIRPRGVGAVTVTVSAPGCAEARIGLEVSPLAPAPPGATR